MHEENSLTRRDKLIILTFCHLCKVLKMAKNNHYQTRQRSMSCYFKQMWLQRDDIFNNTKLKRITIKVSTHLLYLEDKMSRLFVLCDDPLMKTSTFYDFRFQNWCNLWTVQGSQSKYFSKAYYFLNWHFQLQKRKKFLFPLYFL